MRRLLAHRLLRLVSILFIVTLATSFMINLVPGDPALVLAGEGAPPAVLAAIRRQYGFDKPWFTRYFDWLNNLIHGNLGTSYQLNQPVISAVRQRLPVTLELTILALGLAIIMAVFVALYTASHEGGAVDRLLGAVSSATISMPVFLLASILIYFFAIRLRIFPVTGWVPLAQNPIQNLQSAVLPVMSIAPMEMVVLHRILRADLISTLQSEFILVARAKGLPRYRILLAHALRPSSFSAVTLAGLTLGRLLGGTIIVEYIFSLPGIGSLMINAILDQDFAVVQGLVVFLALAYLLINTLVDVLYAVVDPRVRVAT